MQHNCNQDTAPIGLIILDGFGYSPLHKGNAIAQATMPHWRSLCAHFPHTLLAASGRSVGLPNGYMGNSEVGHLTIGAGRVVPSTFLTLDNALHDGSLATHPIIKQHFTALAKKKASLHLLGLLSKGGVHSHVSHFFGMLNLARDYGITSVFIHAVLDGRDSPPHAGISFLTELETAIHTLGVGTIASIHGRFYAMDRDANWQRTKQSYEILTAPHRTCAQWRTAMVQYYAQGLTDEYIPPTRITNLNGYIKPNDGILSINVRADRMRQIIASIIEPDFTHFHRTHTIASSITCCITPIYYQHSFKQLGNEALFIPPKPHHMLLDILHDSKKSVFLIAETEKYAHITYFFHGEQNIAYANETTNLIPSLKAKNYAACPEMSASRITQAIAQSLVHNPHNLYIANYANADMVGHTANMAATIRACEVLDAQIGKLFTEFVEKRNGTLYITSDHGNAEMLIDPISGESVGMHTTNPVPFLIAGNKHHNALALALKNPTLTCIAPIILKHFELPIPQEMQKKI